MKKFQGSSKDLDLPRRHDWVNLADGEWHEAEAGEDFDTVAGFRGALHSWSGNRQARISAQGSPMMAESKLLPNGNVAFRITPAEIYLA